MGSVCCVAAKDRNLPSGPASGAIHNPVCSPPWSFRRDNRRRVADEIKHSSNHSSYVGNRGISMDKLSLGLERGPPSERDLASHASQKPADSEMGTASMITAPLTGKRSPSGKLVQTLLLEFLEKYRTFSFFPVYSVQSKG